MSMKKTVQELFFFLSIGWFIASLMANVTLWWLVLPYVAGVGTVMGLCGWGFYRLIRYTIFE